MLKTHHTQQPSSRKEGFLSSFFFHSFFSFVSTNGFGTYRFDKGLNIWLRFDESLWFVQAWSNCLNWLHFEAWRCDWTWRRIDLEIEV